MSILWIAYAALAGAILCEVIGTTFLMKSQQFTRLLPTLAMIVCYTSSFYFLSQATRVIPLGTTYALWGGLGIVLTTLIGVFVFKQPVDLPAVIGIALIFSGVIILNLFSKTVVH